MDRNLHDKHKENSFVTSAYDSMFNFTDGAIALFDTDLNIVRSNKHFDDLALLYSATPKQGSIFDLITSKDDNRSFLSVFDDKTLNKEITLKNPQGEDIRILQVKMGPIKDNGKIIGGYSIFIDITEFRNRENLLNKRYKLICSLVDNANLGIVIIGQDHKVIESNDRFCEMIGYSQNEITDLHSWDWEYLIDENAIRHGFADLSEIHSTFDTIHKRKDGTTYHATVSASGADVFGDGKDVIMCISEDISAKKEMEEKLRLSETKFRTYLENAADMILTVDSDEKIGYISPNCEKICGFKPEDLTNKNICELVMAEKNESDEDNNPFSTAFKSDKIEYRTFKIKHSDGFLHWYGVTISRASDVNGKNILICNTRNIDQNIEKEKKLVHLSLYDHLTGIPNRAFFDAMLERFQVSRHRPLSLLMCDLDYMKTINDTYGHAKGDEVLQKTAQLIQSSLRKEDFIARIGGDEFAVILPGADNKEALVVIERISETFNNYNSDKSGLEINISIGFSTVKDTETSLADALCKADMKMYTRKQVNKSLAEL